eukprot:9339681-Pyramimonas_sp.AAC.1
MHFLRYTLCRWEVGTGRLRRFEVQIFRQSQRVVRAEGHLQTERAGAEAKEACLPREGSDAQTLLALHGVARRHAAGAVACSLVEPDWSITPRLAEPDIGPSRPDWLSLIGPSRPDWLSLIGGPSHPA